MKKINVEHKVIMEEMQYYHKVKEVIAAIINAEDDIQERYSCLLTGGSSAKKLYQYLAIGSSLNLIKTTLYFSDERCVSLENAASNYTMTVQALFPKGVSENVKIERMRGEAKNVHVEAERYAKLLPQSIDVMLLSVGSDGHVASVFPNANSLNEIKKTVIAIEDSPKSPSKRITITKKVIKTAKNIVLMAEGEAKGEVLAKALLDPENINELPVRLTIGNRATWVLDQDANCAFNRALPENSYKTRIIHV